MPSVPTTFFGQKQKVIRGEVVHHPQLPISRRAKATVRVEIGCLWSTMHIFRLETIKQTTVITLEIQSLDAENVQYVTRCVESAMSDGHKIIVDLGALRYFDVGGFAAILNWAGGGGRGADVRVCSRSGAVRALFELLRAQAVVPLYQSLDDARGSFARPDRKEIEAKAARMEDTLLPGQRIA